MGTRAGRSLGRIAACTRGLAQSAENLLRRSMRRAALSLALSLLLVSGTLGQLAQAGFGGVHLAYAASASQNGSNPFQAPVDKGGKAVWPANQLKNVAQPPTWETIGRPSGVTMTPVALRLIPTSSAHVLGSDKRLEVTVPAGAVTPSLLSKAGGIIYLHVVQTAGASGGTNSGRVSLGTYEFSLVDAHGQTMATAALAHPLQLVFYTDGMRGAAFDIRYAALVSAPQAKGAKASVIKTSYDLRAHTISAIMPLTGTIQTTWDTDSPNGHWTPQTDVTVNLPAGDVNYSYPVDVPQGPGGLAPKLALDYSSGGVADQHYPLSASGWVGEGWDLSVGSISWEERNVAGLCTVYSCACDGCAGANWQSTWQFSDTFGNSGELIPPDTIDAPWYDDTTNTNPATYTPGPISVWHLSDDQHVKVYSYNNPTRYSEFPSNVYPVTPPCFRAFLPNGIMEEYGCTHDSLQWYVAPGGSGAQYPLANYIYRWDLDMIADASGNQIHFTYSPISNLDPGDSMDFPIDTVLSSVTYDSPGCHDRLHRCGDPGSTMSWQPAVQISFQTSTTPSRSTGANCPTFQQSLGVYKNAQTMRCDDVPDLQEEGGLAAPKLQSLVVLNEIDVQVTPTPATANTWHTLRTYQLSFEQAPSSNVYPPHYSGTTALADPFSGAPEAIAGYTDLTQISEVSGDGTVTLPPLSMSYATYDEYYVDAMNNNLTGAQPSTNCPWWWNSGDGACPMWSQTFNERYLTGLDNGRGWHESFTYELARNNTHGVPSGAAPLNPFACVNSSDHVTPLTGSPCKTADDENWSRIVLMQRQASVLCVAANDSGCGSNGTSALSSTWTYTYTLTDVTNLARQCNGCNQSMYWGNQNDGDTLDFYNERFMGFAWVNVTNPDGSVQAFNFYSTEGVGLFCTVASSCPNTNPVPCASFTHVCGQSPWTDYANLFHGQVQEEDDYDTNGTALLKQMTNQPAAFCPPLGVPPSPSNKSSNNQYVGELTSELDWNNPVVSCQEVPSLEDVYQVDGGAPKTGTDTTVDSLFAAYGATTHFQLLSVNTYTTNPGSTPVINRFTYFVWNDSIGFASNGVPWGTYIDQVPAIEQIKDDPNSTTFKACTYFAFDGGAAGATGPQSSLTKGFVTRVDQYTATANCASSSANNPISTASTYDANTGNLLGTKDADAMAGITGHTDATDCTIGGTAYSSCAQFDALYDAKPIQVTNALGQKTLYNYTTDGSNTNSPDATNGWGQWLTTTTDPNSQVTAYGYDAIGRLTAEASPADALSNATAAYGYPVSCSTTGAAEPCTALTTTQRVVGATTVTSATYYDGWGRPVETLTPQQFYKTRNCAGNICGGYLYHTVYAIQYTVYDASGRVSYKSDPYFVTYTSTYYAPPSFPPYERPDLTQPKTSFTYDGLGRTLTTTDPLGKTTTSSYAELQPQGANVNDTNVYAAVVTVDANGHKGTTLTDGYGRLRYTETYSGNGTSGNSYALYGATAISYDWLGDVTSVTGPNPPPGAAGISTTPQTSTTYDLMGRVQTTTNADLGTWITSDANNSYDPDGNLLRTTDARSVTEYAGYDGLDRQIWRSTSSNGSNPYVQYTYDGTGNGNLGKGHLTQETFAGGTQSDNLSGSYSYVYDGRGQVLTLTQTTTESSAYSLNFTYNDAGQPSTVKFSDSELFVYDYSTFDWLTALTTTSSGGSSINLVTNISYSGTGGAAKLATGASVANGAYTLSAGYDNNLRSQSWSLSRTGAGSPLFSSTRSYDAVGNVTSIGTQLAAGTDNQAFCYDDQDRLTWAGSNGTPACSATLTPGSLTSAYYSATFSYDVLGRITQGSLGAYTYGDSAHPHAATSAGTGYSASYDAAGDMTCRAPTNTASCAGGSTTGAQLTYDAERRLSHWQSAPGSNPSSSADYLYDGEGHRAEQVVTAGGSTTKTYYLLDGAEELTVGASSTLTKYYPSSGGGLPGAINVGGSIYYLAADGLGSVSGALDGNGNATASQLFGPYGGVRYSMGSLPTARGFTGQYGDAATGLDYYNARYYDPALGQFASADSDLDGLNPFAYVHGNPETQGDPTGHCLACIGAAAGFVVGFGGYWLTQEMDHKPFDLVTALKFGVGGAVAGGLIGLLGPAGGEALNAVLTSGLIGAAEGGIQGLLQPGHTAGSVLQSMLAGGIAGVIGGSAGRFVSNATDWIKWGTTSFTTWVPELGSQAARFWGNLAANVTANAFVQFVNGTFDRGSFFASMIAGGAGSFFSAVLNFRTFGQLVTTAGADLFGQLSAQQIENAAASALHGAQAAAAQISSDAGAIVSDASSTAGTLWSDFSSGAGSLWSWASSDVQSLWSDATSQAGNFLSNIF
jgi:RHS repeat-associated protein